MARLDCPACSHQLRLAHSYIFLSSTFVELLFICFPYIPAFASSFQFYNANVGPALAHAAILKPFSFHAHTSFVYRQRLAMYRWRLAGILYRLPRSSQLLSKNSTDAFSIRHSTNKLTCHYGAQRNCQSVLSRLLAHFIILLHIDRHFYLLIYGLVI